MEAKNILIKTKNLSKWTTYLHKVAATAFPRPCQFSHLHVLTLSSSCLLPSTFGLQEDRRSCQTEKESHNRKTTR